MFLFICNNSVSLKLAVPDFWMSDWGVESGTGSSVITIIVWAEWLCLQLKYKSEADGRTDGRDGESGIDYSNVWFGADVKGGWLCYDIQAAPPRVLVCFKWLLPLHLRGVWRRALNLHPGCFCFRLSVSRLKAPTCRRLLTPGRNKSSLTSARKPPYRLSRQLQAMFTLTVGLRHLVTATTTTSPRTKVKFRASAESRGLTQVNTSVNTGYTASFK